MCVVVDREQAFVSSANFTQAPHTKNIEVGVLIRSPSFLSLGGELFEALGDGVNGQSAGGIDATGHRWLVEAGGEVPRREI